MPRHDWLARFGSRRVDRRRVGLLGAALAAVLVDGESDAARRRRKAPRERPAPGKPDRRPRHCGGIAGMPCPVGFICIDDPGDDCDPQSGGADCFGICVRAGGEPCGKNRCERNEYCCNPSCGVCAPPNGGCAAVSCPPDPEPDPEPGPGERCGKNVCPRGQYCCNASCGICAPKNAACLMIACVDEVFE